MPRGADDGSWSRAYMAGSGLSLQRRGTPESPDRHIAEGADLTRERMVELASHRDPAVREAIARREDCPFGVLAALAHDSRPAVRGAVASHSRAGTTVLEFLAADRDAFVVKAVVRNPATDASILAGLSKHRREEVRHLVSKVEAERAGGAHSDTVATPLLQSRTATRLHALGADDVPAPPAHQAPARKHPPATLAPRPVAGRRAPAVSQSRPPIDGLPTTGAIILPGA